MVTGDLRSKLALDNEAVQIQVCADYNFHSEELFKVSYWTKVVLTLAHTHSGGISGISPAALKLWWNKNVCARSLPGLRKVLHAALRQSNELTTFSLLKQRFDLHFLGLSSANPPTLSVARRLGGLLSAIYRLAISGEGSDEDSPAEAVEETEIIFSSEQLEKLARELLRILQERAGLDGGPLDSILVTETDVARALTVIADKTSTAIEEPFVAIPAVAQTQIAMALLVDRCGAVGFRTADLSCLKLPPVDAAPVAPVTDRDRAYLMSEIAAQKLMAQETSLGDQWATVDAKLRAHLAAGRKPLALAALKERKLIEQRMEEIQIYKLKLAESTSVTQTAVIQQAVIQAIAVGTQAARAEALDADTAQEILDEAKAVQDQVRETAHIMAHGQDVDESVLLEYEQLVAQQEGSAVAEIDQIPSPPTAVPAEKAPQLIIPEEWIEG